MKTFKTLVATDFSKSSYIVLAKALKFTQDMKGELHVIHVAESSLLSAKKNIQSIRENSYKKLLEDFPTLVKKQFYCVSGKIKDEVSKIATVIDADMIIIGKSGESYPLDDIIFGSNTKNIVYSSNIPVLVMKNIHEIEYKSILIPSDLSTASAKSIEALASFFPYSKLHILNFYYLPYETRLNTYGYDEAEVKEYQDKVLKQSQTNMEKFVSSLLLPQTVTIDTFVTRSSLNAQLFNKEVQNIDFDLLAMHTTGSISFYAFDLLEASKKDVIIFKESL